MVDFILFITSTIGMSHIIVDGSIFEKFRFYIKKYSEKLKIPHLGTIVECYMCSGTWCGFLMGWIWLTNEPFKIFACGCAGGFVSNLAAMFINYIESLTIINLPQPVEETNQETSQEDA